MRFQSELFAQTPSFPNLYAGSDSLETSMSLWKFGKPVFEVDFLCGKSERRNPLQHPSPYTMRSIRKLSNFLAYTLIFFGASA